VATSVDELELPRTRLPEKGYGTFAEATVMLHLVINLICVVGAVKLEEDFPNHGLLILGELADAGLVDMPIVVHLGAEFVIKGKADGLALLIGQAFVEGGDEGFGLWSL
jgi:hypothetical protein